MQLTTYIDGDPVDQLFGDEFNIAMVTGLKTIINSGTKWAKGLREVNILASCQAE